MEGSRVLRWLLQNGRFVESEVVVLCSEKEGSSLSRRYGSLEESDKERVGLVRQVEGSHQTLVSRQCFDVCCKAANG